MKVAKYGTEFPETELLLAAQEEDREYVEKILDDMTVSERRALYAAAEYLVDFIDGYGRLK